MRAESNDYYPLVPRLLLFSFLSSFFFFSFNLVTSQFDTRQATAASSADKTRRRCCRRRETTLISKLYFVRWRPRVLAWRLNKLQTKRARDALEADERPKASERERERNLCCIAARERERKKLSVLLANFRVCAPPKTFDV